MPRGREWCKGQESSRLPMPHKGGASVQQETLSFSIKEGRSSTPENRLSLKTSPRQIWFQDPCTPAGISQISPGAYTRFPGKTEDAHLNWNFRYTRNTCLVLVCPIQYLGHAYAIQIIPCVSELTIYLGIIYVSLLNLVAQVHRVTSSCHFFSCKKQVCVGWAVHIGCQVM